MTESCSWHLIGKAYITKSDIKVIMAVNDSSSDAWDVFMGGATIAAGLYLVYKLFSVPRCPSCNSPLDPADKSCPNCYRRL